MSAPRTYSNFDLSISRDGLRYFAKVLDSPAGQTGRTEVKFPFPEAMPWRELLVRLENAILRSGGGFRAPAQDAILREFGAKMFESLFTGEIRTCYVSSLNLVEQPNADTRGMRLKLRLEPTELACLPWEYLWDESRRRYVSLHSKTPLVRYLELDSPTRPLKVSGRLRILGMIANPRELEGLDTAAERRRVEDAITRLEPHRPIDFQWVRGETTTDLLDMAQRGPWHVFHFIGHGGVHEDAGADKGYVVFADSNGGADEVEPEDLAMVLDKADVRLAVLNCCESARVGAADAFSSPGASLVRSGVPIVVAMQFPISDQGAIELAAGFYGALVDGSPVDEAITVARQRMRLKSKTEWGIPIVFMRSPDGELLTLEPAPAEARTAASTEHAAAAPPSAPGTSRPPTDLGRLAAFRAFGPVETLAENDLSALIELGEELLRSKEADAAVGAALAAAHARRGRELLGRDSVEAQKSLSRALDLHGKQAEDLFHRAMAYGNLRMFSNALADIGEAISLDPGSPEFHHSRGLLLASAPADQGGDLKSAVDAFSKAIACGPPRAQYFKSRAVAWMKDKNFASALSDLDTAIGLDPARGEYYRLRSRAKHALADETGRKQDLEMALAKGDEMARIELAKLEMAERLRNPNDSLH